VGFNSAFKGIRNRTVCVESCEKVHNIRDSMGAQNTDIIFFKPQNLMAQFLKFQDERDPNGFMGIPGGEHDGL